MGEDKMNDSCCFSQWVLCIYWCCFWWQKSHFTCSSICTAIEMHTLNWNCTLVVEFFCFGRQWQLTQPIHSTKLIQKWIKWLSLWVCYWMIDSTDSFNNRNDIRDWLDEWAIKSFTQWIHSTTLFHSGIKETNVFYWMINSTDSFNNTNSFRKIVFMTESVYLLLNLFKNTVIEWLTQLTHLTQICLGTTKCYQLSIWFSHWIISSADSFNNSDLFWN